jgi:SET domain-containing protein
METNTNGDKISTTEKGPDPRIPTAEDISMEGLIKMVEKAKIDDSVDESDNSATKSGSPNTSPSSAATSTSNSPSAQPAKIVESLNKGEETISLEAIPGLYEIKSAGKKGLGVFAKVPINRGTTIMLEKPLIIFRNGSYLPSSIIDAYDALPTDSKEEFMTLVSVHNVKRSRYLLSAYESPPPEKLATQSAERQRMWNMFEVRTSGKKSVLSRFYANAIVVKEGAAICMEASRINHSCVPNASYQWDEYADAMQIRITKDIPADTEITISYLDPCYDRKNRKEILALSYDFKCNCIACGPMHEPSSFAANSYDRRLRLSSFKGRDYTYEAGTGKEIRDIPNIIKAFEDEGLCVRQLGMAHKRLGELYMGYQMIREATKCFENALEVFMVCLGPQFEETKKAQQIVERAKTYCRE